MRFIEDEVLLEENNEVWFNKDGGVISGENEKFFAKMTTKNGSTVYYVREYGGTLFDPNGPYKYKKFHPEEIRMVRVRPNIFNDYMLFLTTKKQTFLRSAERGRTNG